nr:MAG TPA: hypothetical protein [Caudoviricetes sp.]
MVNDRLHIICGNCGQDLKESGMVKWEYSPAEFDSDGNFLTPREIYIECKNCSTVHPLSKYVKEDDKCKPPYQRPILKKRIKLVSDDDIANYLGNQLSRYGAVSVEVKNLEIGDKVQKGVIVKFNNCLEIAIDVISQNTTLQDVEQVIIKKIQKELLRNAKSKDDWRNTAETYYKGLSDIEKFVKTEVCEPCQESKIENCKECNYKIILDYIRESEKEVENGGKNEIYS